MTNDRAIVVLNRAHWVVFLASLLFLDAVISLDAWGFWVVISVLLAGLTVEILLERALKKRMTAGAYLEWREVFRDSQCAVTFAVAVWLVMPYIFGYDIPLVTVGFFAGFATLRVATQAMKKRMTADAFAKWRHNLSQYSLLALGVVIVAIVFGEDFI